ncbi:MAG: GNAT family N-acetyltransferase [Pigmentiphaga sp.]
MRIIALRPEHILAVQLQPAQDFAAGFVTAEQAQGIVAAPGIGWAAEVDGQVIACAGIVQMHDERGTAWAMLSADALRHFKTLHRVIGAVLDRAPWQRIEMTVDVRHDAGCRWAERLGFVQEGRMRAYTPDGRDCFLYARVK